MWQAYSWNMSKLSTNFIMQSFTCVRNACGLNWNTLNTDIFCSQKWPGLGRHIFWCHLGEDVTWHRTSQPNTPNLIGGVTEFYIEVSLSCLVFKIPGKRVGNNNVKTFSTINAENNLLFHFVIQVMCPYLNTIKILNANSFHLCYFLFYKITQYLFNIWTKFN